MAGTAAAGRAIIASVWCYGAADRSIDTTAGVTFGGNIHWAGGRNHGRCWFGISRRYEYRQPYGWWLGWMAGHQKLP